jgi:hypothetical protein
VPTHHEYLIIKNCSLLVQQWWRKNCCLQGKQFAFAVIELPMRYTKSQRMYLKNASEFTFPPLFIVPAKVSYEHNIAYDIFHYNYFQ